MEATEATPTPTMTATAAAKYIVYEKAAGWATITWPLWCDNTRNVSSFAARKTK